MSAFEKAWPTLCLPGEYDAMDACDQERWKGVTWQAWSAALEHAAKVCEYESDIAVEMGHERFARYSAEMARKIREEIEN